ncbi:sulfite exporter TauE/SafE family protein [Pseudorhodobacter sp.]|uniref:sulfite exporter TauE/SafE family protein n=1 Tax=Pseudorhodobacter sp. TaxID=1934400 RepID=UPI0026494013|nr:sulfite exporter TauE/SafE family protein [Pseudorhodobacter sp.]MDN5787196.1 sulfite exporter TauE/SafE family protein [Pseudorhodobacter sp.]
MTLPFDLSIPAAVYMAVVVFGAAFVRGYSGFGFSALLVTASSLVTNPLNFVGVAIICECWMTAQQWNKAAGDVDWKRVKALMLGSLIGVPLGLWIITQIPVDAARIVVSLYVLVMCAVMLHGWRIARVQGGAAHGAAGVVAGMANALGMGGLPVVTYFAAQTIGPRVFRATLIAYFAILDFFTGILLWWHGLITWDTVMAVLGAVPMVVLGIWLGGRHFFNTDPQDFRKFAIRLLAGLAVLGFVKSLV